MKPLKVCIITPQYGHLWSGVGTYATHLVNGLAELGNEMTVICPEASDRRRHPKVKISEMKGLKIKPTLGNWIILAYYFNKSLKKVLEKESMDIVHFVDARDSLFCRTRSIPVIGTMHDYYFSEAPGDPFAYRKYYSDWLKRWGFCNVTRVLEKRAVRKLSFIITNSDYVLKSIATNYCAAEDSMKTIYIGIEKTDLTNSPTGKTERLKGNPSILFVGQNFQRKGLPVLIEAVASVRRTYPDVSLSVIGRYGNNKEEEMRDLSKGLGIERNVHFLGWKDNEEVRMLFNQVDIFAMPSFIEGFGLVFLEAMNAGVPVIGGDTGGVPELIQDGVNGFLVKPGDWQGLSERIQRLAKDKDLRDGFVRRGYQTLEKFSLDSMVEKTNAVYWSLRN
ncbi:MAG: glycosyltransferase family 4 protein [Nitrospirae bacterium]|nr:glycosyltransferase family 4 protein [Nitrospirota bacterium]